MRLINILRISFASIWLYLQDYIGMHSQQNVKLHVGKVRQFYPSYVGITKSRTTRLGHLERAYENINTCRILAGRSEGKRRISLDHVEGKVVAVYTMKAYRRNRGIAPLILNHGAG